MKLNVRVHLVDDYTKFSGYSEISVEICGAVHGDQLQDMAEAAARLATQQVRAKQLDRDLARAGDANYSPCAEIDTGQERR